MNEPQIFRNAWTHELWDYRIDHMALTSSIFKSLNDLKRLAAEINIGTSNSNQLQTVLSIDFLQEFSGSNSGHFNHYHNSMHCLMVMRDALKLHLEQVAEDRRFYDRSLAFSALFHDFNHTGGTAKSDAENIQRALAGIPAFLKEYSTMCWSLYNETYTVESTRWLHDVLINIQSTQYPYGHPPITPSQAILRDADVLWLFRDDWYEHVKALFNEILLKPRECPIETGRDCLEAFNEFLKWEYWFLLDHKWHSSDKLNEIWRADYLPSRVTHLKEEQEKVAAFLMSKL